jgi:hypothetical protein
MNTRNRGGADRGRTMKRRGRVINADPRPAVHACVLAAMLALLPLGCADQDPVGPEAAIEPGAVQSQAAHAARVILRTPDQTPGEFVYGRAHMLPPAVDGWVVFEFIRDPECEQIAGFNLLTVVDFPDVFDCPLTVDITEMWDPDDLETAGGPWGTPPGQPGFRTAIQAQHVGKGAVAIYFVRETELLAARADGVLTIEELHDLPPSSLMIGEATLFRFNQLNSGRVNALQDARPGHTSMVAHGDLPDGRRFRVHRTTQEADVISIGIAFFE